MADIITGGGGGRKNKMPRIDLTPMVDLGFLLISFFMHTTALAKPKVMEIQMPYPGPASATSTTYPEESTATIILSANHKALWYEGNAQRPASITYCGFSGRNNLRDHIIRKQNAATNLPENFSQEAHVLHVLIKPDVNSTYEDLVNVLDEMNINDVKRFAIVKPTTEDITLIKDYGK